MKTVIFILVAISVLTVCSPPVSEQRSATTNGTDKPNVQLVHLEDGTRCAVLSGWHSGGITCDWNSNKGVEKK